MKLLGTGENLVIMSEAYLIKMIDEVKDHVATDIRRERLLKKEDEDDWICTDEARMMLKRTERPLSTTVLWELVRDGKIIKSESGYYSRKSIIKYKSGR